jgi:hypothetical protein
MLPLRRRLPDALGTSTFESVATISTTLRNDGFVFVEAPSVAPLLSDLGLQDWSGFASSWNDLGLDTYMADGGRYRRRRHAAFSVTAATVDRKPHQPHYQSRDYNPLNGGVERWFEPITDEIGRHAALQSILRFGHVVFDGLTPTVTRPQAWHAEVHQFRVEARPGQAGRPTPEGAHRDGVDWALVLLVRRENVARGTTSILDSAQHPLGRFTLTAPLDSALVDDSRVFHGVTPIRPKDPAQAGFRDVLVVTFRR